MSEEFPIEKRSKPLEPEVLDIVDFGRIDDVRIVLDKNLWADGDPDRLCCPLKFEDATNVEKFVRPSDELRIALQSALQAQGLVVNHSQRVSNALAIQVSGENDGKVDTWCTVDDVSDEIIPKIRRAVQVVKAKNKPPIELK